MAAAVSSTEAELRSSLELIWRWYQNMIDPTTKRLIYEYDPVSHYVNKERCPIRDIGSVWDFALLSNFLHKKDTATMNLLSKWLSEYTDYLVEWSHPKFPGQILLKLHSRKLGEPSGIAHSAMMLLSLLTIEHFPPKETRNKLIAGLAYGVVAQQREDGSYKIYFEEYSDSGGAGKLMYAGEAMLALIRAHEHDEQEEARRPAAEGRRANASPYLSSVEQAFPYYRGFYEQHHQRKQQYEVFLANWLSQAFCLLHRHAASSSRRRTRRAVRSFLWKMHDDIISAGFYEGIARRPRDYATVEVACGLEGLCDAYSLIVDSRKEEEEQEEQEEGEQEEEVDVVEKRKESYRRAICTAIGFLLAVQKKHLVAGGQLHQLHQLLHHQLHQQHVDQRAAGGFSHGLAHALQRIDVSGHVMNAFIKALQNKISYCEM